MNAIAWLCNNLMPFTVILVGLFASSVAYFSPHTCAVADDDALE